MSANGRNAFSVVVVAALYALHLVPADRMGDQWWAPYHFGLVPFTFAVAALLLLTGSMIARAALLNVSLLLGAVVWIMIWYLVSPESRSDGLLWMYEALFAAIATNVIFLVMLGLGRIFLISAWTAKHLLVRLRLRPPSV